MEARKDPVQYAKEYITLWRDNPLSEAEIEEIRHVIKCLDKLLEASFMGDHFIRGTRIMLATVIGDEE